MKRNKELN